MRPAEGSVALRIIFHTTSIAAALLVHICLAGAESFTLTQFDVPGATNTLARGINNEGQIVGQYGDSTGTHGFLFSAGSVIQLDVPVPGYETRAYGINDAGVIVGTFSHPAPI